MTHCKLTKYLYYLNYDNEHIVVHSLERES